MKSSYTDEVRERVPSFPKVTFSTIFNSKYRRDIINLGFCLFEEVTDYRELRIKPVSFS